eukprot:13308360-Alexandrium_andersonii.AAC.1
MFAFLERSDPPGCQSSSCDFVVTCEIHGISSSSNPGRGKISDGRLSVGCVQVDRCRDGAANDGAQ